jgi:hypothetical protein
LSFSQKNRYVKKNVEIEEPAQTKKIFRKPWNMTLKKSFSEVFMHSLEHGDGDLGNLSPNIVLKDVHGLGAIHENKGIQVPP